MLHNPSQLLRLDCSITHSIRRFGRSCRSSATGRRTCWMRQQPECPHHPVTNYTHERCLGLRDSHGLSQPHLWVDAILKRHRSRHRSLGMRSTMLQLAGGISGAKYFPGRFEGRDLVSNNWNDNFPQAWPCCHLLVQAYCAADWGSGTLTADTGTSRLAAATEHRLHNTCFTTRAA